jgi:hypothetical protein
MYVGTLSHFANLLRHNTTKRMLTAGRNHCGFLLLLVTVCQFCSITALPSKHSSAFLMFMVPYILVIYVQLKVQLDVLFM